MPPRHRGPRRTAPVWQGSDVQPRSIHLLASLSDAMFLPKIATGLQLLREHVAELDAGVNRVRGICPGQQTLRGSGATPCNGRRPASLPQRAPPSGVTSPPVARLQGGVRRAASDRTPAGSAPYMRGDGVLGARRAGGQAAPAPRGDHLGIDKGVGRHSCRASGRSYSVQPSLVPPYQQFLWPIVTALRELGDSGSIDEIVSTVLRREDLSDLQQQVLHGDGPQTEIEYRLAWARTYLKGMGLLNNSQRGIWSLTDAGKTVENDEIPELRREYILRLREVRKAKAPSLLDQPEEDEDGAEELHWRDSLLDALMGTSPEGFERLAQRLLREAGFISATVTGRSGDGGIDGLGIYRMSLVSFPVFFQCKRYKGSVGAAVVRDFRGAMVGRGDKGLLITTGTFTTDAKAEATRDGAPPVDLIDGQRLCDLLKEHSLGVSTTTRQVEDVSVDHDFFKDM